MKFKIFVSYSTDDISKVELLKSQLKDTPLEVFIAEHSITASEHLPSRIDEEIETCDMFVLIWSKNAKKSDWVSQEVGKATAYKKVILPIKLDNTPPTGFIRELKYLEIFDDCENGFRIAEETIIKEYNKKMDKIDENQNLKKQKNKETLLGIGVGAFLFWAFLQE